MTSFTEAQLTELKDIIRAEIVAAITDHMKEHNLLTHALAAIGKGIDTRGVRGSGAGHPPPPLPSP